MQDLRTRIDEFMREAETCDLIADSATDAMKRRTFRRLGSQLRQMAADVSAAIEAEQQWIGRPSSATEAQAPQMGSGRDH